MKTGLVLEGGAMRGIYTAGVLDAFMEQEIHVDGVIGVSAGALHGCSYVSGQHGRSIRYYMKYMRDPRFMSFRSFLKTGNLVETEFCYHEIPEKLDIFDWEAFLVSPTDFYVTCSNVETGEPEYILLDRREDAIDYMRASASMPLVSQIVEVGGYKLLDGGVSDSVPITAFRDMGYERCVVVLTRPAGYRKKPSGAGIGRVLYRKYPAFVRALEQRYLIYNETMDEIESLEAAGEILAVRPSRDPGIGRMERRPDKVQEVYQLGYRDALQKVEQIRAFLGIS
ncbi:MAG: patatin family protein [Lachnospiraceae bacterium]|nr:patatin family protein [Lachnospiraceae bacterium]